MNARMKVSGQKSGAYGSVKETLSGIIAVYKEAGQTSFDVIRRLRRVLGEKKMGHAGTLDPDATGVLVVALGKATRLLELLTAEEKTYVASLRFGCETDTGDLSGNVLRAFTYTFEEARVREAALSFIGSYDQVPPMYSALKKDGKKLYELARQGITVEREPRRITIHELEILQLCETGLRMRVRCSKGTYIRTLCEDIGRKLGYGAAMESLLREKSGAFSLTECHTLSSIEADFREGKTDRFLIPLKEVLKDYPVLHVSAEEERLVRNGNPVKVAQDKGEAGHNEGSRLFRMESESGELLALYEKREGEMDRLFPFKMLL